MRNSTAPTATSTCSPAARTEHLSEGRRRRGTARKLALPALVASALVAGGVSTVVSGLLSSADLVEATGPDPELERRVAAAQEEAGREGIELSVTSGWRSAADQQQLLDEAIALHGAQEAHRQVLPPERSAHVAGTAVDVGPREAAAWLEQHAVQMGLCRTYENEWWHFEVVGPVGAACPRMWADASHGWR